MGLSSSNRYWFITETHVHTSFSPPLCSYELHDSPLPSTVHPHLTYRAAAAGWCGSYYGWSCCLAGRGWMSLQRTEWRGWGRRWGLGTLEEGPGIWGRSGGWGAGESCGSDWWWWMLFSSIAGPVAQRAGSSALTHALLSEDINEKNTPQSLLVTTPVRLFSSMF